MKTRWKGRKVAMAGLTAATAWSLNTASHGSNPCTAPLWEQSPAFGVCIETGGAVTGEVPAARVHLVMTVEGSQQGADQAAASAALALAAVRRAAGRHEVVVEDERTRVLKRPERPRRHWRWEHRASYTVELEGADVARAEALLLRLAAAADANRGPDGWGVALRTAGLRWWAGDEEEPEGELLLKAHADSRARAGMALKVLITERAAIPGPLHAGMLGSGRVHRAEQRPWVRLRAHEGTIERTARVRVHAQVSDRWWAPGVLDEDLKVEDRTPLASLVEANARATDWIERDAAEIRWMIVGRGPDPATAAAAAEETLARIMHELAMTDEGVSLKRTRRRLAVSHIRDAEQRATRHGGEVTDVRAYVLRIDDGTQAQGWSRALREAAVRHRGAEVQVQGIERVVSDRAQRERALGARAVRRALKRARTKAKWLGAHEVRAIRVWLRHAHALEPGAHETRAKRMHEAPAQATAQSFVPQHAPKGRGPTGRTRIETRAEIRAHANVGEPQEAHCGPKTHSGTGTARRQ